MATTPKFGTLATTKAINNQTGTTYTFVLGDGDNVVSLTNAAAIAVTIPTNASVPFPIGTIIKCQQGGAGAVSLAGAGVTIQSKRGAVSDGLYSEWYLTKMDTDTWNASGDMSSPFMVATGGTITEDGDYKVHTFTASDTFSVSLLGDTGLANADQVEYLVVAGGGGGGATTGGGGGGAGGYKTATGFTVTASNYSITVGAGGAGNTEGTNSVFDTVTSTGGGASKGNNGVATDGGSGGGGAAFDDGSGTDFGSTVGGGQGNNGGTGNQGGPNYNGGGGGGAGAVGRNTVASDDSIYGTGGAGLSSSITGAAVTRAGGGGGGNDFNVSLTAGGSGGGGDGGNDSNPPTGGTVNTGGGAGGVCRTTGTVSGGSGVVILRYKFK